MLDPVTNFAKATVSTGYDASEVTVVLRTGDGAKFPQPSTAGAFNLVYWNYSDYKDPSDDPYVEIVRCTARTSDTLTITRAQESTSASAKNISGKTYKMILAITKKMIDDVDTSLSSSNWVYDYTPSEALTGNTVFTLPVGVTASQVVVYADGGRAKGSGLEYVFAGGTTITFVSGRQPNSSISVDYLRNN